MAENKKRFKLNIANKNYVVIGDSTPAHMRTVSRLVDEQLAEIMAGNVSREDAAVLLAINAVSDQLKKQQELDDLRAQKQAPEK
ncbi:hypothetical protein LPAF129_15360 [Ligilactobacillus pabuli]|uniref:Cell division protein ZapA n=1 Tax=Ligilactobacillus pabuli TaxID=2886039 RepID=A0ABQ5JLK2_9LACO|nr:cell division protein ZapA [Ligilactobacillus pabuli]GKS81850.1 hypothetical protein LPAF129_15360 [Ligilactobacillus pabuli]HIW88334.1 cell division protein ZapA [Candidatus Ligilactobacillus excrementipullorum]